MKTWFANARRRLRSLPGPLHLMSPAPYYYYRRGKRRANIQSPGSSSPACDQPDAATGKHNGDTPVSTDTVLHLVGRDTGSATENTVDIGSIPPQQQTRRQVNIDKQSTTCQYDVHEQTFIGSQFGSVALQTPLVGPSMGISPLGNSPFSISSILMNPYNNVSSQQLTSCESGPSLLSRYCFPHYATPNQHLVNGPVCAAPTVGYGRLAVQQSQSYLCYDRYSFDHNSMSAVDSDNKASSGRFCKYLDQANNGTTRDPPLLGLRMKTRTPPIYGQTMNFTVSRPPLFPLTSPPASYEHQHLQSITYVSTNTKRLGMPTTSQQSVTLGCSPMPLESEALSLDVPSDGDSYSSEGLLKHQRGDVTSEVIVIEGNYNTLLS